MSDFVYLWSPVHRLLLIKRNNFLDPVVEACAAITPLGSDASATDPTAQTFCVPLSNSANDSEFLIALGNWERVRIEAWAIIPSTQNLSPNLRRLDTIVLDLALHWPHDQPWMHSGNESPDEGFDQQGTAEHLDAVCYAVPGSTDNTVLSNPMAIPPLAAKEVPQPRLTEWLMAEFDAVIKPANPGANPHKSPFYTVPRAGETVGRARFVDMAHAQIIEVNGWAEQRPGAYAPSTETSAGTSANRPRLQVRVPADTYSIEWLMESARVVHWRRQQDYLETRLAGLVAGGVDAAGETGDALANAIVDLALIEAPENYATSDEADRLPDRALYIHQLWIRPDLTEQTDSGIRFDLIVPDVRFGDVFGVVFRRGEFTIAVAETPGVASTDYHVLRDEEHALFVYRDQDTQRFDVEPNLLRARDLRLAITEKCDEVVGSLGNSLPESLSAETTYRNLARSLLRQTTTDKSIALGHYREVASCPIFALGELHRQREWYADFFEEMRRHHDPALCDEGLQMAVRAGVHLEQPVLAKLMSDHPKLLAAFAKANRWRPGIIAAKPEAQSIAATVWAAGYSSEVRNWIAGFPIEAQLIAWTLLVRGLGEILPWLQRMNILPDAVLLSDISEFLVQAEEQHEPDHSVFLRLRQVASLSSDGQKLSLLLSLAHKNDDQTMVAVLEALLARDRDSKTSTTIDYANAVRLLSMDKEAA